MRILNLEELAHEIKTVITQEEEAILRGRVATVEEYQARCGTVKTLKSIHELIVGVERPDQWSSDDD
jgi:hypothetical protein